MSYYYIDTLNIFDDNNKYVRTIDYQIVSKAVYDKLIKLISEFDNTVYKTDDLHRILHIFTNNHKSWFKYVSNGRELLSTLNSLIKPSKLPKYNLISSQLTEAAIRIANNLIFEFVNQYPITLCSAVDIPILTELKYMFMDFDELFTPTTLANPSIATVAGDTIDLAASLVNQQQIDEWNSKQHNFGHDINQITPDNDDWKIGIDNFIQQLCQNPYQLIDFSPYASSQVMMNYFCEQLIQWFESFLKNVPVDQYNTISFKCDDGKPVHYGSLRKNIEQLKFMLRNQGLWNLQNDDYYKFSDETPELENIHMMYMQIEEPRWHSQAYKNKYQIDSTYVDKIANDDMFADWKVDEGFKYINNGAAIKNNPLGSFFNYRLKDEFKYLESALEMFTNIS